jgi:hypothetical protein
LANTGRYSAFNKTPSTSNITSIGQNDFPCYT